MYHEQYEPFYKANTSPADFAAAAMREEELARMRSYYPESAKRLQEVAEHECQGLDYAGSFIYDEYPDRWMLQRLGREIRELAFPEAEITAMTGNQDFLNDLALVLLLQEIANRRCRNCQNPWPNPGPRPDDPGERPRPWPNDRPGDCRNCESSNREYR